MDTLTVVNRMLGKMGQAPVESLTEDHAFIPACLLVLDNTSEMIQARGWWFNTEKLTIEPDEDGYLVLPGDALSVRMLCDADRWCVKRGTKLYDANKGTDVFTASKTILVVRHLPFDDLVPEAQAAIGLKAIKDFQSDYDGDATKTRQLDREVAEAGAALNAAHIRAVKYNALWQNHRIRRMLIVSQGIRRYT